ncbi:dihydroxyacetone kinase subunit DhaK [Alphaproteobacteria bacterium]|nr:dihydroxyacetone kinase subunit DhaK [Alphaproteobacteria bacterium]
MKKFINNVDEILTESLVGFGDAHNDILEVKLKPDFITRKQKSENPKVALISGGGSGHEPLHGGFVGYGMLDAACPGQVFTAPTPDQMEAAANHVHSGKGILFIVKNYSGDIMNFEMGADMLDLERQTIIVNDDVAVEDSTYTTGRRGVAGTMIVEKTVGSLAETGASLDECKNFGDHVNKMTASMGVAFTSCIVPAAGKQTFDIGSDEMEFGVGIHGEPGRKREKIKTANEITSELMGAILEDLKPSKNQEVLLHANGFGGTPLMELYLLFNSAKTILDKNNIKMTRSLIGNFTTSLDMAGGSLTVTKLDDKIIQHWDSPVHTPAIRWKI